MPVRMDLIYNDDVSLQTIMLVKTGVISGNVDTRNSSKIALKCEDLAFCIRGKDERGFANYKKSDWKECPTNCVMMKRWRK